MKHHKLTSDGPLTTLIKPQAIDHYEALLIYIKALPYGRNKNRRDLSLVWKEKKGSCSSKHAFLKEVAKENSMDQVHLMLGIYAMDQENTPKIGTLLLDHGLTRIPEAHCYLKVHDQYVDCTDEQSDFDRIKSSILIEEEIEPHQVSEYKVDVHKAFLKTWMKDQDWNGSFDDLWAIREQCIAQITNSK